MPIVTISRQFGAGGSSVAGIVAAELGAEVVDKKLIEEVARRLSMQPSEVEAEDERPRTLLERLVRSFSTLEPGLGAGWAPPYPDPLYDPRKEIIQLTEQVIKEVAAGGNVVIVGRGAGFVLSRSAGRLPGLPAGSRGGSHQDAHGSARRQRARRQARDARDGLEPGRLHQAALRTRLVRSGRVRPGREHGPDQLSERGADDPQRSSRTGRACSLVPVGRASTARDSDWPVVGRVNQTRHSGPRQRQRSVAPTTKLLGRITARDDPGRAARWRGPLVGWQSRLRQGDHRPADGERQNPYDDHQIEVAAERLAHGDYLRDAIADRPERRPQPEESAWEKAAEQCFGGRFRGYEGLEWATKP